MASRYLRQFVLSQDPRQVLIAGNISLSSSAAVTSTSFNSLVASVVKTATGTYTITLSDKYQLLRSCSLTFEGTDATADIFVSATDVSGAKTIIIKTALAGVVADVTSASKIHVSLVLKDSTAR